MVWRRRKSFVKPRQQIWFGLELVVVAIGFIILAAFLLFVPPMSELMGDTESNARVLEDLIKIVLLEWPLVTVAMLVLFIIGLLMSHRLAGPLFGLEKVIADWSRGDRTARVRFRKYDYLLSLKEPLNSFFDQEEQLLKQVEGVAQEIATHSTDESARKKAGELLSLIKKNEESE